LSRDPLGELAGVDSFELTRLAGSNPIPWRGSQSNRYAYVRNDPGNKRDPSGLADWEFCVHFTNNQNIFCKRQCDAEYLRSQGFCSQFFTGDEYDHETCYLGCAAESAGFHVRCLKDREYEHEDDPYPDDDGKGAPCYDAACAAFR
jgi:hypothetical protein